MIAKDVEKHILKTIVTMMQSAGYFVREYGMSHLLPSRVGDDGKGNEFVISLRYDENNTTSNARCEEKG